MNTGRKRGERHVTRAGRSVIKDLFSEEEAVEMEIRGELLRGLQDWRDATGGTQTEIGRRLGISQGRVSDIKRGKISSFSLDLLLRLAVRAGLRPHLELVA